MKIVLSGVETKNKGAELMLYAILEAIERKFSHAIVYIPGDRLFHKIDYISTNVDFRVLPCYKFERKLHLISIFRKLNIPYRYLPHNLLIGKIDYFLDGSGFKFSDKHNLTAGFVKHLKLLLSSYYTRDTKIVYLPQAFGPFENNFTQKAIGVLGNYSSLIFSREKISSNYLKESGLVDMSKVTISTDFTSLVEGKFPKEYNHLKNGICIIPNMRMIDMGAISFDNYITLLSAIIDEGGKSGRPVYLLNHEGRKDENFCNKCQSEIGDKIEVVTNLNALEVKGLIASAYIVVTSRYHGLASALNSCVPSLATSWSHKYEELYRDYGLDGYVLPLNDISSAVERVKELLDAQVNTQIRNSLSDQVPKIKSQSKKMWEKVWSI